MTSRGAKCSRKGKEYEIDVASVCKQLRSPLLNIPLNTQHVSELGGCSSYRQDLILNFRELRDVGVEVKRPTPDWIQMSIRPLNHTEWCPTVRVHLPQDVQDMFLYTMRNIPFPAPPFFTRSITHQEWNEVKHMYKDMYYSVANDTIAKAYRAKRCQYIQLKGYGLYHTGEDVCGFGVPLFCCEQRVRVRCKRHGKKDVFNKHIPSSVMISFRPKLSTLLHSPFSLDSVSNAPPMLRI